MISDAYMSLQQVGWLDMVTHPFVRLGVLVKMVGSMHSAAAWLLYVLQP